MIVQVGVKFDLRGVMFGLKGVWGEKVRFGVFGEGDVEVMLVMKVVLYVTGVLTGVVTVVVTELVIGVGTEFVTGVRVETSYIVFHLFLGLYSLSFLLFKLVEVSISSGCSSGE